jgi:AraC family transcriptional activator of pobA
VNAQLVQQWFQEHKTPDSKMLDQLFKLIDVHFTEHRLIAFYCEKLNTTPSCLNKLTQFYLGKSLHEVLQERLLMVSQHMLRTTLMTVKGITYELGFEDPGYFCRWFKKLTGKRPKEWRRAVV